MTLDATIGGASSDSYVTLAEYATYAAKRGWTLETTDAANEINLIGAMDVLAREYTYAGYSTASTQALQWPRVTGIYIDGYSVDTDIIPQDIKDAQCEMAYLIQGGATPFATVNEGAVVSNMVKAGSVESKTDYAGGGRETPRYVAIEGLLNPYITNGAGQIKMVRA